MRRWMIAIIVMGLPLACLADNRYLVFWCNENISANDAAKIRAKIKVVVNDPIEIHYRDLPRWRSVANPGIIGRTLCIDIAGRKFNFTKAQAEAWRDANLDEPNKLKWVTSNDPRKALIDAGLEPVP